MFRVSCVAAIALVALAGTDAAFSQCLDVTSAFQYCPDCAGYSVCTCLYVGAFCPSYDVVCAKRRIVTSGLYALAQTRQPCQWLAPCSVSNPSEGCDPLINPCLMGPVAVSGWYPGYHRQDLCEIEVRGPADTQNRLHFLAQVVARLFLLAVSAC